ncbi:MAG: FAD-dependent oxidoreductase [Actinomycetota bacterium]
MTTPFRTPSGKGLPVSIAVPDAQWLWENEPCRAACPVHTDAGAYVTAIADGRYRDAYLIARGPNPFPSICGRVCAAPCETSCRRGKIDTPIAIRALKRFVSERFGVESFESSAVWHEAHGPVPPAAGPSIGVIGGGPAGMAAAHDLRLAGHPVTVYESQEQLGGMMVLGIPEYRLPRTVIAREIEAILELGIEARTGCHIGRDVTMTELLVKHAAVFLGVGCARSRDLDLPGREKDGILRAVEFLINANQGFHVDLGKRVIVIGGGNVAFDAARTALRAASRGESAPSPQAMGIAEEEDARRSMTTTLDTARAALRAGVSDVTVVALESEAEMPAAAEEIAEAEAEGIKILHRLGPHAFVGNGRVTGLETIGVASVFDEQGRFAPTFVPGTESVLEADTVILAVGQAPDLDLLEGIDVERTARGQLVVDRTTLRTSHPKIWTGGDVAFGPRNLIDAIAEGRRAAASIHAGLGGAGLKGMRIELAVRDGFRRLDSDYDGCDRVPVPMVPTDRRVGFTEVETGYDEDGAVLEGSRCLRCFDNIMLDTDLCILCGLCVDVCPYDCITIVRADHANVGIESQSALLLDEDVCIRCGLCVNRCPPGALSMVHAKELVDG